MPSPAEVLARLIAHASAYVVADNAGRHGPGEHTGRPASSEDLARKSVALASSRNRDFKEPDRYVDRESLGLISETKHLGEVARPFQGDLSASLHGQKPPSSDTVCADDCHGNSPWPKALHCLQGSNEITWFQYLVVIGFKTAESLIFCGRSQAGF
jgi:hypothetical protein